MLFRLGQPDQLMFDEVYYVEDAREVLQRGASERFVVHPPLVSWLIAGSITLFGDHPAAWRAPAAAAGFVAIWWTHLLALRLTGRRHLAALAAALLALDGVFLAQARIAMLDVFVVAFVVVAAWLLVLDRQRRDGAVTTSTPPWALLGAGAMLGSAVAAKWSGLFALAVVASVALGWEVARLRRQPVVRARRYVTAVTWLVVAFLLVPGIVYTASWVPWLAVFPVTETGQAVCPEGDEPCLDGIGEHLDAFAQHHRRIAAFHLSFEAGHRYQAPPTTWPWQLRPVTFHWQRCDAEGLDRDEQPCGPPGQGTQLLAVGNLGVWWIGLLALPVLVAGAVRRDGRSIVPLALLVGQYLPWLAISRAAFSFYAAPLVPFLTVGIALSLAQLDEPRRWRGVVLGTLAGAATGVLVIFVSALPLASADGASPTLVLATALLGGWIGARRDRHAVAREPIRSISRPVTVTVLAIAVALFTYFAPVWFAIPWDLDALQARWWFRSWI
jgi:dolichyl-phosphate-mannose-protein mannosyltransferase